MPENARAVLTDPAAIREYVLGGHGAFTLVSRKTGERRTFRVSQPADARPFGPYFLRMLSGPDNESDYRYVGAFWKRNGRIVFSPAPRPGMEAAKAIGAWLAAALGAGKVSELAEFWHEGRCGKCGRLLTDPESIARGIGPVCCGQAAALAA